MLFLMPIFLSKLSLLIVYCLSGKPIVNTPLSAVTGISFHLLEIAPSRVALAGSNCAEPSSCLSAFASSVVLESLVLPAAALFSLAVLLLALACSCSVSGALLAVPALFSLPAV